MSLIRKFKQLISRFTDKEVCIGVSTTVDDELVIDAKIANTAQQPEHRPIFSNSIKYHLKPNAGSFKLVGLIKSSSNTAYQLQHTESGKVFNVPPQLFNLLFKKYIAPKA